jgi:hypothetical protein
VSEKENRGVGAEGKKQCWNFRTIYEGLGTEMNRVVVPAGFTGWRNRFLGIDSWLPRSLKIPSQN